MLGAWQMKIIDENITFLVTGKIDNENMYSSKKCFESIKTFFPKSKLILSTWDTEKTDDIHGVDKVITNNDNLPSYNRFMDHVDNYAINNVDRQQLCISNGLAYVDTEYVVRFRTDFFLKGRYFLEYYEKWNSFLKERTSDSIVFNNRILCSNIFIYNPAFYEGMFSFMMSDCFQFGLIDDLRMLWSGVRHDEKYFKYFYLHPELKDENYEGYAVQYLPEQSFLIDVLRNKNAKKRYCFPEYYYEGKKIYIDDMNRFYANNVIVGNNYQLGVCSKFDDIIKVNFYSLSDLLFAYSKYCDNSFDYNTAW